MRTNAIAFFRVGFARYEHQDTLPRQQKAVKAFAKTRRLRIVDRRLGHSRKVDESLAELARCSARSGAQVVIVESATTLAKDAELRERAIIVLAARGTRVLTVAGEDLTAPHATTQETDVAHERLERSRQMLSAVRADSLLQAT